MNSEKSSGKFDITAHPELLELTLDVLFRIKAAITNVRLYPPTSNMARQSLGKLYAPLVKVLEEIRILEINETSGDILINGCRLKIDSLHSSEIEIIRNLKELFVEKHIKNITFRYGLQLEELENFIILLSGNKHDKTKFEKSLLEKMNERGITHIKINERIYRPVGSDDMVVGGAKDYFEKNRGALDELMRVLEEIKEIYFADSSGTLRDEVKMQIAEKVFGLKPELLSKFLNRSPEVRKKAEEKVHSAINPQQLKEILSRLVGVYRSLKDSEIPTEKIDKIKDIIRFMIDCSRDKDIGIEMSRQLLDENLGELVPPPDSGDQTPSVRAPERARELLEKDSLSLIDEEIRNELPEIFKQLDSAGEKEIMRQLVEKLSDDLQASTLSVRSSAVGLFKSLYPVFDLMSSNIADTLFVIIREQTEVEHDEEIYENIASILLKKSMQHIRRKEYGKAEPVIRMYHKHAGQKKEGFVKRPEYAEDFLKKLSVADTAETLFKDLKSRDRDRQKAAYRTVMEFGKYIAPALVEEIKNTEDFGLRQFMLSIIKKMGEDAVSYFAEEVESEDSTPKVIRILQLLPGIQNDTEVFEKLERCLKHPRRRIRVEAVLTLPRVEENYERKGRFLLECLDDEDDLVRREAIKMLGELKYKPAVKKLINITSPAGFGLKSESEMIRQAACGALGNIGEEQAGETLISIIEGGRWYNFAGKTPGGLKISAIRALKNFKGKEVENALKKALDDKDKFVRAAAESALENFH